MKTINQLNADEKTKRIQGLLNRLSPDFTQIIRSAEEQEKVAALFEEALYAHYNAQTFPLKEKAPSCFNGTADADTGYGTRSQAVVIFIELAIQRLQPKATDSDPFAGTKDLIQQSHKLMQQIQPTTKSMTAYKNIMLKTVQLAPQFAINFTMQLLKFFDLKSLEDIKTKLKIDTLGKRIEDIKLLHEFTSNVSELKAKIKAQFEVVFFNLGLVSQEFESLVSLYVDLYTNISKIDGILEDIAELRTLSDNENYLLSLQFLDLAETEVKKQDSTGSDQKPTLLWACAELKATLIDNMTSVMRSLSPLGFFNGITQGEKDFYNDLLKITSEREFRQKFVEHYSNTFYFSMVDVKQFAKLFFYVNSVEAIVSRYSADKSSINAKDFLLIVHLGNPRMRDFIRTNRSYVDEVFTAAGYVESLIIQDLASAPDITLEELEVKALQKPKVTNKATIPPPPRTRNTEINCIIF